MSGATPRSAVRERSAGVVPVRSARGGPRVLVLRSYRTWDFPKGRVEPGETLLEAALREAAEEAALVDLRFPWGLAYCTTEPYGRGKVASYFLARTREPRVVLPVNPELGRPEHHEGRWVSFTEAAFLLPTRLQPILAWAHNVVIEGRAVGALGAAQPDDEAHRAPEAAAHPPDASGAPDAEETSRRVLP